MSTVAQSPSPNNNDFSDLLQGAALERLLELQDEAAATPYDRAPEPPAEVTRVEIDGRAYQVAAIPTLLASMRTGRSAGRGAGRSSPTDIPSMPRLARAGAGRGEPLPGETS
jgi:hypothetical protein